MGQWRNNKTYEQTELFVKDIYQHEFKKKKV